MADIVITPGNVAWVSGGAAQAAIAGTTFTAGQLLYNDPAGTGYLLAKANVAGKKAPTAIALTAGALGQPFLLAPIGSTINIGGTLIKGQAYYLSGANAGGLAPAADITAGWDTVLMGFAASTANLIIGVVAPGITN